MMNGPKKAWKKHFGPGSPKGPVKVLKIIGLVIGGLFLAALFGLIFGAIVMALWNALMPKIFGLDIISYWQAVGLVILARLIFGGIGGGKSHDKDSKDECDFSWEDEFPENTDWKDLKTFWNEEGKEHFEEYMKKKNPENAVIEAETITDHEPPDAY